MPRMSCGSVSDSPASGIVMECVDGRWSFVVGEPIAPGVHNSSFAIAPRTTSD
jgi:hypothetical protein